MSWQDAVAYALTKAAVNHAYAIATANKEIVDANRPSKVTRIVDGNPNATDDAIKIVSKVTFQYVYLVEIVAEALALLKEKSPVSADDSHPGLYRDSHMVFLNGVKVDDVSGWLPGQVIHVSNPVPYSRKVETGRMKMSLPGHVYEDTAQLLQARYGNSASIKFVYMPFNAGGVDDWASSSSATRNGRRQSISARGEWLRRQPALEIKAL